MAIPEQMNRGLDEWADILARHPVILQNQRMARLVLQLRGDKLASTALLNSLDLPRFGSASGTTADFIDRPGSFFGNLRAELFYVSVNSVDSDYPRRRIFGLDGAGIYNFVDQTVGTAPDAYKNVLLMETAPMLFGGNIVVGNDPDNSIYGELADGTHSDLVGGKIPTLQLTRDPLRGLFRFTPNRTVSKRRTVATMLTTILDSFRPDHLKSTPFKPFGEEHVRTGMYQALLSIPHRGEGRDRIFHPGYYEFALVQMRPGVPLRPIFIDHSNEAPFQAQ